MRLSGGGCTGPDAGVGVTLHDADGEAYNGDGGAADPKGTWTLDVSIGPGPSGPGRYTVRPQCRAGGGVAFEYEPRTFTLEG